MRFTYEISGIMDEKDFCIHYIKPENAFKGFDSYRMGEHNVRRLKIRELSIFEGMKLYQEAYS